MPIKNVIIVGLGAIGTAYAVKLNQQVNLKILASEERIAKYKKSPRYFNNTPVRFEYITENDNFKADLIIISTKFNSLENVISLIKNFVFEDTIILPLINGISAETILKQYYPNVLNAYYIGHSVIRKNNMISYDGIGKIVFGSDEKSYNLGLQLSKLFDTSKISYEFSKDIIYKKWVKLGVNIILNQISAINNMTVREVKKSEFYKNNIEQLLNEIVLVANKTTGKVFKNYKKDVLNEINLIAGDGITSMLQDIRAKKKTEVEIFSGEIIKLASKYNINVPLNEMLYNSIKSLEENF